MRGREEEAAAVATAVGRRTGGRGGACSGCGQSEAQREGMATLLCSLSLGRKTYIREVQGHYGPIAWAGPPLSFQRFSFFLLHAVMLLFSSMVWRRLSLALSCLGIT
jgi:hypothetical protein